MSNKLPKGFDSVDTEVGPTGRPRLVARCRDKDNPEKYIVLGASSNDEHQ